MPRDAAYIFDLSAELADPATAAAVVLPVPYDETSSWMKGADRGPAAVIEASTYVELLDTETWTEPHRRGIASLPPLEFSGPPERLAERVQERIGPILDSGRIPIVLGGEHSVTIGAVRAAVERFANLSVLQVDAHADTRDSYHGSPYNHACVMARVRELCPIVQVGIRSLDAGEAAGLDRERVIFAHEIVGADDGWLDRVTGQLTDEVYVTLDLDAFDPSILPATGTPEPGGLDWYDVTRLLDHVADGRRIVGFDVVELLPSPGQHASAFTAAKLVYRALAAIYSHSPGRERYPEL